MITDRTQADVERVKKLAAKGWARMTPAEQAEWNAGLKGAYNHSDLNRVELAVSELTRHLGLTLATKTNWNLWDIPTQADMARYLSNVKVIRNFCPDKDALPVLPSSLRNMTYTTANAIETTLETAAEYVQRSYRCGELYCGEV
jgi:hypothetical protein